MLWELICKVHLPVCFYHVTHAFQSESTLYTCLNFKEGFAQNRRNIWILSGSNKIWTHNLLVCKRKLNRLVKLAKWLSCAGSAYLHGAFDCMLLSCYVTFQSESTLFSCLNANEFLAQNRRDIWNLSDSNETRTHNHLVCKQTLNNLAKLVKCIVQISTHNTVQLFVQFG